MHGGPGRYSTTTTVPAAPLRMSDIASLFNQGDAELLDQYSHGFFAPPPPPPLGRPLVSEENCLGFVKSEAFEGAEQSAVTNMSNITSASGEASGSSGERDATTGGGGSTVQQPQSSTAATGGLNSNGLTVVVKRKRNLPGTPDPDAEVIALSPKTLMATNRFVCEICNKGFQRDQNLQLHRRGHNLPWKLKQRTSKEIRKRVYICPEPTCVHHDPARALGDLTGIKKHFCRKHGEKKWKCDKCSKRYAVQSDWKAHSKTCGTREYRCDCGTLFSRRDSFITHRAFCDALAEESARVNTGGHMSGSNALAIQASGGPLSMMTAPLSPGRSNLARLGGPSMDPLSSTSRSGLLASSSSLESNLLSGSAAPSSWPRLSLWLGTGPASGNEQLLGNGHLVMNPIDPYGSVQGGTSVAGMFGPLDNSDGHKPLSAISSLSGMTGSSSHYSNLLMAGVPGGQAGLVADLGGMSGLAEFGALSSWPDRSASNRLPHAIAGALSNANPAGLSNNNNNSCGLAALPSVSSLFNQPHSSSSAQMSATALLQKAAQIGATASNNSLLKGFGNMAGLDTSSWPSLVSQDRGGGMGPGLGMISSLVQSHNSFTQQQQRGPSAGFGNKGSPSGGGDSDARNTPIGNAPAGSIHQELLPSTAPPSGFFGSNVMSNIPSPIRRLYSESRHMGGVFNLPANENMNQNAPPPSSRDLNSSSQHLQQHKSALMGFGSVPKSEDGVTRDFLGVRGVNTLVASQGSAAAAAMAKSLTQRDLSSIYPVGMEQYSSSRENLRSLGINGQSPGRSWDNA